MPKGNRRPVGGKTPGTTATTALLGFFPGGGFGGKGGGGSAGASATYSDTGPMVTGGAAEDSGSATTGHMHPTIRKGYLLMLRGPYQSYNGAPTPGVGALGRSGVFGETGTGDGGSAVVGTPSSVGGGASITSVGGLGGEWAERFFYLSGHFLRYQKRSFNLASVNFKQTDHVEFNLQPAVVETLEEAGDEGDDGIRPQRRHAFRLVANEKPVARTPRFEGQGVGNGGGSREGGDGDASDFVSLRLDDADPSRARKVWVLAATSEEERAMWMQAIREAISLGQELLSSGEAGRESSSLAALAGRMSRELEIRDRHYRLKVYRSCFVGEDAVSWLLSECEDRGPCSVEEALLLGNRMIAAGLIYHCNYDHGLENSRLFYKFADSVVAPSRSRNFSNFTAAAAPISTGGVSSWGGRGRGRGYHGSARTDIGMRRSNSAGGGSDAGSGVSTSGVGEALSIDVSGRFYGEQDAGLEEDDGVDSAVGSLTSASVDSGNGSVAGLAGSGGGPGGGGEAGGSGIGASSEGNADALRSVLEEGESFGRTIAVAGGGKSASVRRLSREMEELKLACAELERSQLVAERQAEMFASRLLDSLEDSMDRVFSSIVAIALLVALSDSSLKVLLATSVAFVLYSYVRARETVRKAADDVLARNRPEGLRHDVVPLLHPSQAKSTLMSRLRRSASSGRAMVSTETAANGGMLSGVVSPDDHFSPPEGVLTARHMDNHIDGNRSLPGGRVQEHTSSRDAPRAQDGEEDKNNDVISGDDDRRSINFSEFPSGGDDGGGGGGESLRGAGMGLPPEEEWPHHPIFVRLSPSVPGQVRLDGHHPQSSIPLNTDDMAVPFETPLFKGRLLMRVKGLTSGVPDQGDGAQAYFRGKKRLVQCAVQGCFKKEMAFDRVYTGQVFERPFTKMPAKWLIRSAFAIIRRLSPALRDDITGDRPYMVSPLAATSQAIRAEEPGDECAIVGDLGEETALLGGSFMERRVPASARKKFFSNPRNLKAYSFKPGVVYTFDFYQHLYNAVTFEIDLGFRKVKLADYLNQQPAQIMALDFETKETLWNIEIWHVALLLENHPE